ncbi:hypothetical protein ACA910_003805 [Epithemia clementina (nom. ined.)]
MSSTMKKLRRLNAMKRLGKTDSHRLLVMADDVADELRATVLQKTKSAWKLEPTGGVANDGVAESVEDNHPPSLATMELVMEYKGSQKPLDTEVNGHVNSDLGESVEEGKLYEGHNIDGSDQNRKSFSFLDDIPEVQEEPDCEPGLEPEFENHTRESLPEYLDLVQSLSTILIPKFARLAYDAQNETTIADKMIDGEAQDAKDPSLATRLKNRFVAYGRRKLQMNYETPEPYAAKDVLNTGRQALLKTIPGHEDPVMDETLVQLLFLIYGEFDRANDEQLVKEMVRVAKSASGRFDEESLINAISSDLSAWDPTCVDTPATFFYDVFGIPLPGIKTKLKKDEVEEARASDEGGAALTNSSSKEDVELPSVDPKPALQEVPVKQELSLCSKCYKFFFPVMYAIRREKLDFSTAFLGVDMVVDVAFSTIVLILIWISYILVSFTYVSLLLDSGIRDQDCEGSEYGCLIAQTIYSWVVIACILIAVGMVHIAVISVGNNPADQSFRRQVFACLVTLINTFLPFGIVRWAKRHEDKISYEVKTDMDSGSYKILQILTLVVGGVLALVFAVQGLILLLVNGDHPHKLPRFLQLVSSATSWDAETRIYKAAKFKVDKIISNALCLHKSDQVATETVPNFTISTKMALEGTRDEVSRNFITRGETKEQAGGIVWTFWKFCDGSLHSQEGLWINTRLLAKAANDVRASLGPDQPEWILDLFPTGAMVEGALIPATFSSLAVLVLTIILYVPSSIATVLKYRGKLLPSLGSPYFQKVRKNVDMTYMNTANAIYGLLGSTALVYFVVGLFIFLFLWPYTKEFMVSLTAWILGLGVTILLRMVLTGACRKAQYRAYYRIKPAGARITSLALECWYIGVAVSILIARISQFVAAAVFWVGRIDAPYLSEDVVLFGYGFDMVPSHYCKDLLVHEAHRHPYIERLTQMYLMMLRHGDRFISNACTAWRQLLVLAMMPWMLKYRVFKEERRIAAELEAENEAKRVEEEEEEDQYYGIKQMQKGATETGLEFTNEVLDAGGQLYGAGAEIADEFGKMVKSGADKAAGVTAGSLDKDKSPST